MAEPWECPKKKQDNRDYQDGWEAGQEVLVEWLKIVLVKADYADIGDIRIIAEPDWRRLCKALGVEE